MVAVAAALFTIGVAMGALAPGPWSDTSLPPRQRAALLLKQMNLTEKINYVHGGCDGYELYTHTHARTRTYRYLYTVAQYSLQTLANPVGY